MKNKLLILSKRLLFLVLALYLTSNLIKSQTIKGSWTSITSMPTARWFPGTTVCNDKIYIIGGNSSATTASLSVMEVYNPATDTWETKSSIPKARSQVSACTVNGKIYVIGGSSGPASWTPVPDVYIYDPATDTWSKGTNMPSPRTEMALVAVQDKIYAIGGITAASAGSKSVDIYDPATDTWSKGADMPTARGTMPACELNSKIYVFGGSNGGSSWTPYSTLEVYDVANDTWSTKASMPELRSHLTGCVLNNKIYELGGTRLNLGLSYSTVFSYDPQSDSWESEPSMIKAREAFKAVVVNGKIYAIGGTQVQTGLVAFSNAEVYDTVPKVFISNPEMRLPSDSAGLIGKLFVPNSGSLKFTYQINDTLYDGSLFAIHNDSVITAQNFGLNSNKQFQFEILAISENNDSVKTVIKLSTYFKVDAVFTSPMGFTLKSSNKKVMLDVLSSRTTTYGFMVNSDTIYKNMKNGVEPFNNIDLIFTSHTHTCHFDPVLLFNAMKNNPKAISIMTPDVKNAMNTYFNDNPDMLNQVFAPVIPLNSFIDTTLAGIKIRLTSMAHEGSNLFCLNMLLDSIHFLLFDDYIDLTNYKTIGFTQIPTDVGFIGSLLLDADQHVIKQTFSTSSCLNVCHIENYSTSRYNTCVANANKLKALNYQINVLNWPMQMFSYKKTNNSTEMITLNSAPQLKKTFGDLTVEKYVTKNINVPKSSFVDADLNDTITYSFAINNIQLPDWAVFDTVSRNLELTPTEAKNYTVTVTATDNHLCFANTSFRLIVTNPAGIESTEITKFKTYPNPAQSVINIEGPGDQKSSFSVNLFNILGEKIYSGKESRDNKITIDISQYSASVMYLIITSNGKNECHKIIKY